MAHARSPDFASTVESEKWSRKRKYFFFVITRRTVGKTGTVKGEWPDDSRLQFVLWSWQRSYFVDFIMEKVLSWKIAKLTLREI